jgi:hypothetical protein
MERRAYHSPYELLQQDRYTQEEAAEVLGIGLEVVRHATFTGELRAQIIEHDIISIRRDDVLAWLAADAGPSRYEPPARDTSEMNLYDSGTTRTSGPRVSSTTS